MSRSIQREQLAVAKAAAERQNNARSPLWFLAAYGLPATLLFLLILLGGAR